MTAYPKILAIIPARGGSKGIPKKNIKLLAGKPLIAHTIESSLNSKYITKVVVSTEDEIISKISKLHGAEVIERKNELAEDHVPLDPVIYHTLSEFEKKGLRYDVIATIQPTSPLIKTKTIDEAIETFIEQDCDTLITVKAEPHLYWTKQDDVFIPLYSERKNRQYLEPLYKETGSMLISKREIVSESNRIGNKLHLYEVPSNEAIDIDNYQDWLIAENELNKKTIVFRVDGSPEIGMGHVFRALTLADKMFLNHNVYFLMDNDKKLGIEKIKSSYYPLIVFNDKKEMYKKLNELNPDIVINDILDTEPKYISELKAMGYFVVNYEDLGEGSDYADLVINSLYENTCPPDNHYYGYKYVCLRDEFQQISSKVVTESVNCILITFGGTDPNNLTLRTLKAISKLNNIKDIKINVIIGMGYSSKEELSAYAEKLVQEGFQINIKENVLMMAYEIYNADIVITSNGRTIYEITSIGTPFISIAQNERESKHLFVHFLRGIMYLGMAYKISEDDIYMALTDLLNNPQLRKKVNKNLLKINLLDGVDKNIKLIEEKYTEWGSK
ncbi:CMP-N-acetylneuraminic acid synthetase [Methanohalophilus euhalobius]|jgi:CMP-N-acetylneuraminic acid synthetase/spore coat polysaccharide biosynthesis predicted glycosyltransferase SpsG|uniref:CMP-N-acetylneuraminic acid synthetase n=1 Tax=Methanohalophilus euhalobius TaxID=51203 RepID=A0A285G0K0_9EURY|nr:MULTISPECIES: glycosyltransferase [Methanohalophilus]ODV49681.1 MAG: CMP-N-acetylneuraminic acid synthetase NeuA [Methanohalophilus sp. 2-GBenrich]TCL11928.1 CMP-N-acetylneuraminic acid synthetase [Methanohalophilus euhalobius]SNY17112.1 CMP-N-acetylneuraminic acid synthetase [Methanohalophilus euhalobius]